VFAGFAVKSSISGPVSNNRTWRPEGRFIRASSVIAADIGDQSILLDEKTGAYFSLNSVGQVLWHRLSSPAEFSQLCAAVSEEFDVEPSRLTADLQACLQQLVARDLATTVSDLSQEAL
jgi:hypothetical protein